MKIFHCLLLGILCSRRFEIPLQLNLLSLVNREDTACKRLMSFSPFALLTRRLAIMYLCMRNCSVLFTI